MKVVKKKEDFYSEEELRILSLLSPILNFNVMNNGIIFVYSGRTRYFHPKLKNKNFNKFIEDLREHIYNEGHSEGKEEMKRNFRELLDIASEKD